MTEDAVRLKNEAGVAEYIYDWNTADRENSHRTVELDDETLRDGLQSVVVRQPTLQERIHLLHLMNNLGIHGADIGIPTSSQSVGHVLGLAQEIVRSKLTVQPNCAARTMVGDVEPIVTISQKVGIPIEVAMFIGSSRIRAYVEEWSLAKLLAQSEEAIRFAIDNGLPVMFVTEDTTRAFPDDLRALYQMALRSGATRLCFCDTVGHATPYGVRQLIRFARNLVEESGISDVKIDWHGHNDRGMGLANALAAIEAGAHRIHGTALGVGERCGNTPMDQLLVNLRLHAWGENDVASLEDYVRDAARHLGIGIPPDYPVFGQYAFSTATGVHAAAVAKAYTKDNPRFADLVYSGVPASDFGRSQHILIGPMSGESNVIYWLEQRGLKDPSKDENVIAKILDHARRKGRILAEEEVADLI